MRMQAASYGRDALTAYRLAVVLRERRGRNGSVLTEQSRSASRVVDVCMIADAMMWLKKSGVTHTYTQ